jgi:hypothetical protein
MDSSTKLNLSTDANGAIVIETERTRITIQPDGTVALSSYDPIQLTGASRAKLDKANLDGAQVERVEHALRARLEKKTSN